MTIYMHPEKYGLRTIKDHDTAGSYEFDLIVVWARDTDGTYWVGHDSGCSCPSPFESADVADLTQVRTLADVAAFARARPYGWDENAVAALLDGLRLDGAPAVVDGTLVGAEPALPAGHEAGPCSACGMSDADCVRELNTRNAFCCGSCAIHVTHESL